MTLQRILFWALLSTRKTALVATSWKYAKMLFGERRMKDEILCVVIVQIYCVCVQCFEYTAYILIGKRSNMQVKHMMNRINISNRFSFQNLYHWGAFHQLGNFKSVTRLVCEIELKSSHSNLSHLRDPLTVPLGLFV